MFEVCTTIAILMTTVSDVGKIRGTYAVKTVKNDSAKFAESCRYTPIDVYLLMSRCTFRAIHAAFSSELRERIFGQSLDELTVSNYSPIRWFNLILTGMLFLSVLTCLTFQEPPVSSHFLLYILSRILHKKYNSFRTKSLIRKINM